MLAWVEELAFLMWLLLLRVGSWLWPMEVQHQWTSTTALLLVRLPQGSVDASLRLLHITDAHVSEGQLEPWERAHAERMHNAFREVRLPVNGSVGRPISVFRELIDLAGTAEAELVALGGDIVNFPHKATSAWTASMLSASLRRQDGATIPYVYTAGNHDWFYEGLSGSQTELRQEWRRTALQPLYDGSAAHAPWQSHDFGALEVGGILVLTVDNSLHQVTFEQLTFLRTQLLRWLPTVLLLHVPLSVNDSLRPFQGYALCGDPAWGESTDRSWRDERRARWPKEGNSRPTELFLEAVLAAAAPRGRPRACACRYSLRGLAPRWRQWWSS